MRPAATGMTRIALGLAIWLGVTSSSNAQKIDAHHGREAAIHECSERAALLRQHTWGVTEIQAYRSCMAARHQAE